MTDVVIHCCPRQPIYFNVLPPTQLLLVNGIFRSLPTGHRPHRCPGRLRQGSFQVGQDEHEHRDAEEQSQCDQ
jgi:hypothetical protein